MDRRTVSIVGAILVVGGLFAFAGDLDPPEGPIGPTMHTLDEIYAAVTELPCCSPRPEDIRTYHMLIPTNETIIIPKVEGTNGFVLTDVHFFPASLYLFQDTGEGPVQILRVHGGNINLATGIPLVAGSTITVLAGTSSHLTLTGYVY